MALGASTCTLTVQISSNNPRRASSVPSSLFSDIIRFDPSISFGTSGWRESIYRPIRYVQRKAVDFTKTWNHRSPFFSRVCIYIYIYHNLLICDTSTFDNSAEYTFFMAEEIRVNFYFVVDQFIARWNFFFYRKCKFVLSLSSFFFLFSFRHFREDTHGESWFLGHPQKWRITVNVNFWGAERVKRCVYRRSSRGIYFACCWRGKYFSRCSMALEPNFSWKRVLFVNRYRVIRLIDTFRSRIRLLKMLI